MAIKFSQGSHFNKRKLVTSIFNRRDIVWRHYDAIFPVLSCYHVGAVKIDNLVQKSGNYTLNTKSKVVYFNTKNT